MAPPGGTGGPAITGRTTRTRGRAAAERTWGLAGDHLPTREMVAYRRQWLIPRTSGLPAHGARYGGGSEGALPKVCPRLGSARPPGQKAPNGALVPWCRGLQP